ncbi:MAG: hypothetical protein ACYCT7_08775 [bacterium]
MCLRKNNMNRQAELSEARVRGLQSKAPTERECKKLNHFLVLLGTVFITVPLYIIYIIYIEN